MTFRVGSTVKTSEYFHKRFPEDKNDYGVMKVTKIDGIIWPISTTNAINSGDEEVECAWDYDELMLLEY